MIDLTGQTFTRLTVVGYAGINAHRDSLWLCRCVCGNASRVRGSQLRGGRVRSCGCLRKDSNGGKVIHGHAARGRASREYFIYLAAKQRCENSKAKDYQHYGGRGIEMRFKNFQEFYSALGPKPSPRHTVDRIDNNGHYEAGNVRWATWSEQRNNQRPAQRRKRTD